MGVIEDFIYFLWDFQLPRVPCSGLVTASVREPILESNMVNKNLSCVKEHLFRTGRTAFRAAR